MKLYRDHISVNNFGKLPSQREKLEFLLEFALLAPSSHNSQPWLFKIDGNRIIVLPHHDKHLKDSDPTRREMFMSIGAAIANLTLACRSYGLRFMRNDLSHDPSHRYEKGLASFVFDDLVPGPIDEDTLHAIINRHTNRSAFSDKPVPQSFIGDIQKLIPSEVAMEIITGDRKTQTTEIVLSAIGDAFSDKKFTRELSHWIKPSLLRYKEGMPGYNLEMPLPISFLMPLLLRFANLSKPQIKMNREQLEKSPAFVVLSTQHDTAEDWLKVGEAFEYVAIEAQKQGLHIGVMAAPIEIGEHYQSLQKILNTQLRPQVFFRLGFAQSIPRPSPRHAVKHKLAN